MSEPVSLTSLAIEALAEPLIHFLDENGVDAWVKSEDGGGMFPNLDFIQGIHVMVSSDDLGRAKELLEAYESMADEGESE